MEALKLQAELATNAKVRLLLGSDNFVIFGKQIRSSEFSSENKVSRIPLKTGDKKESCKIFGTSADVYMHFLHDGGPGIEDCFTD